MNKFVKGVLLTAILALSSAQVMAFQFPDVPKTHWASNQIDILSDQGVIVGYPDGTFKPDENVTRAEFAAMAIKALGQEHTKVMQTVNFTDITPDFWAYDAIQRALYFDLITEHEGPLFRPEDNVSRAEATTVAVNALTTAEITPAKAMEVLSQKYGDVNSLPKDFLIPAGKSEILSMIVVSPNSDNDKPMLEPTRPATRAEVAAILYNMREQAKLNPNAKLAEAMRKKTGEGFIIKEATVQGSIATIPEGAVIPVKLTKYISTQSSNPGEVYVGVTPQNLITKDKYILVYANSNFKGQLLDVRSGKWFVRNGVMVIENSLITTNNDQVTEFKATGELYKDRNWFMKFVRATLKGEKLEAAPTDVVYMKLLKPVKIDLTNGWIYED